MATLLYRLGRTAYHRWPRFLVGWLAILAVFVGLAAGFSKPFTDSFSIPGIPSEEAADIQQRLFPGSQDAFDQATVNVIVQAPGDGALRQSRYADAIDDLVADIRELPQMDPDPAANPQLGNPVEVAAGVAEQYAATAEQTGVEPQALLPDYYAVAPLTQDGRTGVISFTWDVETVADVEASSIEALEGLLDQARDSGLAVEMNGQGSRTLAALSGTAELIGLGLALVVLLLTFGSLVAAGLPIINALVGVGIGLTGVLAMTVFTDLNSSTIALSSMIGLAVGIDYTLFILARYRSELQRLGGRPSDRAEAVGIAVGTAGSAVVFAGLTVLIALAALAVVGIPFLTAMGLAAAGTVLIAVLVALTLLPALLGLFKSKAFGGQVRRYEPTLDDAGRVRNNGVRWARLIGRRPAVVALLAVVGLGALAVPMTGLDLAFPSDATAAPETTQRQASDLSAEAFGPGRDGPLLVVVDLTEATEENAIGEVVAWAAGQENVANAQVVGTNEDGTGALIQVLPVDGPDAESTGVLLDALRGGEADLEAATGTDVGITGLTAITTDVSDRLASALPVYLAVVIGLALVLLVLVFRSLLVPLTATFGFLLSVLATIGVTVAVFQNGTFGLFAPQPIVSFMPVFLVGVVFGLAMDYQVFLVSRMREAHVHGASPSESVVEGFRSSARVVTAAAIIMTAVFAGFILEHDPVVQSLGFALAIAIVFDAFVVRMTLIPALMYLLGERAWWLPRWLDRLLPHVDVEGEKLQQHLAREGHDGGHTGRGSGRGDDDRELEPVG